MLHIVAQQGGFVATCPAVSMPVHAGVLGNRPCLQKSCVHALQVPAFLPAAGRPCKRWRRPQTIKPTAPAAAVTAVGTGPLLSSGMPVWAGLMLCAAVVQLLDTHSRAGRYLGAPLLAIGMAATAAAAGVLPTSCVEYDAVWNGLMPLAAALYLLETDLRRLATAARPVLLAFVVGAAGTALGTVVSFRLLGGTLGPEGYKMAGALCASYIGGSINFAATAAALKLSALPLACCMAADNLAMAAYLGVVMALPADQADCGGAGGSETQGAPPISTTTVSSALAAATLACAVGSYVASNLLRTPAAALTLTALLCSVLASVAPKGAFAGGEAMAGALMLAFFAVIGAGAGERGALTQGPAVLQFILLQLLVHMAVLLVAGRLLRLPMQALLVASNANVGGPATAAAMATARGWTHMVTPAMLVGSLGYAVGTAVGCAVGRLLKP